jgi:hypothetical protein
MSIEKQARAPLAPLASLADLTLLERRFVEGMRLWLSFEGRGDARPHTPSCDGFAQVLERLLAHCRRPLQVGDVGAESVTGDECVLARFVTVAADGERENAILIATLLVRADVALDLGRRAEALGLALRRTARRRPTPRFVVA